MPPLKAAMVATGKAATTAATQAKVAGGYMKAAGQAAGGGLLDVAKGAGQAAHAIGTGGELAAQTTLGGKIGSGAVQGIAGWQGHGPAAGLSMLNPGGSPATPVSISTPAEPYSPRRAVMPGMIANTDGTHRVKNLTDYFEEALTKQ